MNLAASRAGDLGVHFHLFFVVVRHPLQEGCKRRTAILAKVVSVLVAHIFVREPRFHQAGVVREFNRPI